MVRWFQKYVHKFFYTLSRVTRFPPPECQMLWEASPRIKFLKTCGFLLGKNLFLSFSPPRLWEKQAAMSGAALWTGAYAEELSHQLSARTRGLAVTP